MPVWSFARDGTISLKELQNEFDRFVDRLWHGGINTAPLDGQDWAPAMDVVDESDRYVIAAEVPGMNPEDIDISVVERNVTISGARRAAAKPGQEHRALRSERRFGNFKRGIELPELIDENRVSASCTQGVLTISLPKKNVVQGRKVPIDARD